MPLVDLNNQTNGVTPAERYLKRLCDHTFLSLWSYSGIYRDQGRVDGKGDGKEICDLLVVFENHILVFSDKDCAFPDSGDLDRDWARWYRRAVVDSAKQIWGAERWIRSHPDRLFLDRTCTRPFPIDLPDLTTARFHRIVVAHNASKRCMREHGGSGSLMIVPAIEGARHFEHRDEGGIPLAIGQVDPTKGYVHVLDDTSLQVLMSTLDTITDFVSYLSKKEQVILNGRLGWAAGEEELLAFYLGGLNDEGEHDFVIPPNYDKLVVLEGLWSSFESNPSRLTQIEADKISYMWDRLIESFSGHIVAGTQHFATHRDIRIEEKIIRLLARERRTRRRMLARSLHDMIFSAPEKNFRIARVMLPSHLRDPHYVFLLLPELDGVPYGEYREVRRHLLFEYCRVVKLKFPDAEDIVGIATETGMDYNRSEDAVYFDARVFSDQDRMEAQSAVDELGLLKNVQQFSGTERDYPEYGAVPMAMPIVMPHHRMKGRNRNDPCPCGSEIKFKLCCGR